MEIVGSVERGGNVSVSSCTNLGDSFGSHLFTSNRFILISPDLDKYDQAIKLAAKVPEPFK